MHNQEMFSDSLRCSKQGDGKAEIGRAGLDNETMNSNQWRVDDWVEVRSKEEILATLDAKGQLEGLPFMPQMFQYCGQRFRIYKRAHKTCDTVNDFTGRKMNQAVHLQGIRCDGQAYGGCQAACLIFWKEAWLKKASEPGSSESEKEERSTSNSGCREQDVWKGTKKPESANSADPAYVCQATQVPAATKPLSPWEVGQYVEDFSSGNVKIGTMLCGFIYMAYHKLITSGVVGLARPLRWLYDTFQRLRGGIPYPRKGGTVPASVKTPTAELNLQPGEWVRVKSYDQILSTLDATNKNRGLFFDAEMVPYCGHSFRVLQRVKRIVNEKTGKITEFKNACIMLEGVVCGSRYSECRLFCPRSIYSYWREIWLERLPERRANPNMRVAESARMH
jgi:hypothetical protein